jgi:uncharacterized membrane protein YbhN (UPF0104 family)
LPKTTLMLRFASDVLRALRSRRARIALHASSVVVAVVVTALVARHFAREGWPLADASIGGVVAAASLLLLGAGFRAFGWRHLFPPKDRPRPLALATASGASSVTGLALPSRFDELVRIAVLRRYPGKRSHIGAIVLSLFLLGLVDNAALVPLASVAAGVSAPSGLVRAGLIFVASTGLVAALVVLALPRLAGTRRLIRFRLTHWLSANSACAREASKAWALLSLSWLVRGTALLVLLDAFGLNASIPLALLFLCASAASSVIPIAPAGAATQAGAGAAILIASGVGSSEAIAFAVASQALIVLTGAAIVLSAGLWHAGIRLAPARA